MEIHLNFERVLCRPFFAEPFAFVRAANRAVSLLPILPVKRMARLTMSFLRVNVRDRAAVLHGVLVRSKKFEVLRIYASWISTNVINDHPVRDFPMGHEPCDTVRSTPLSSEIKSAVPVFVQRPKPIPATLLPVRELRGKSDELFCCQIHSFLHKDRKGTWSEGVSQYGLV